MAIMNAGRQADRQVRAQVLVAMPCRGGHRCSSQLALKADAILRVENENHFLPSKSLVYISISRLVLPAANNPAVLLAAVPAVK